MGPTDQTADADFAAHRPLLFSIAYRMLGSAADAEDIVQECYLRWRGTDRAEVRTPKQYLATTVTRLCIDQLQSARARREEYVGSWLPEPVGTTTLRDPVELAESLTMAFLVMLESLSPVERAVFLLGEVFDYSMEEIAAAVDKTSANCRQILHRARQAVAQRRRRYRAPGKSAEAVMRRFTHAVAAGDVAALIDVLEEDAVLVSDGGGKAPSAVNPLHGSATIAKFFLGIAKKRALEGITSRIAEINRQPALVNYRDGKVQSAAVFDIAEDRIGAIYIVANPEKLAALNKEYPS
jgi:RNA polymerase sigma-70 factor, ECF subfamily